MSNTQPVPTDIAGEQTEYPFVSAQTLHDISERGEAWYRAHQTELEAENYDKYVAVQVDSGVYAVAPLASATTRELRRRGVPGGRIYVRRIGNTPEPERAARLFGPGGVATK